MLRNNKFSYYLLSNYYLKAIDMKTQRYLDLLTFIKAYIYYYIVIFV